MSKGWKTIITDKKTFYGLLLIIVLSVMVLMGTEVFTQERDGRRQIVDIDGGEEVAADRERKSEEELRLQTMLSQIAGVGENQVMITWQETEDAISVFSQAQEHKKVQGVIVAAEGASNTKVQLSIINAVASVYDIPVSSVMVFQLEQ